MAEVQLPKRPRLSLSTDQYERLVELYMQWPGAHQRVLDIIRREDVSLKDISRGQLYKIYIDGVARLSDGTSAPPIKDTLHEIIEEERLAQDAEAEEMPALLADSARENLRRHVQILRTGMQRTSAWQAAFMQGENPRDPSLFELGRIMARSLARDLYERQGSLSVEKKYDWLKKIVSLAKSLDDHWANLLLSEKTLRGRAQVVAMLGGAQVQQGQLTDDNDDWSDEKLQGEIKNLLHEVKLFEANQSATVEAQPPSQDASYPPR